MKSDMQLYLQHAWNDTAHTPEATRTMDYWIIGSSLVLITLGLIMVGSASVSVAEKYSGDPFYYLWRQLLFTAVGVVALLMTLRIPMKFWESLGLVLIISSGVLLALVFIPGLGRTVNGSARWVNLAGFTMQPSEMVKLFCIIYMAGYLVRHQQAIHDSLAGFVRPLLLMMVIVVLLLLEPDFGSIAVLMVTIIALMWLAGVPISRFALLSGLGLILLVIIALGAQYRTQRLTTFLHPWDDPFNSGFQLTQALIAFGRGEWFGVGLGASVQKLFYLPEAHTDFLFAVLAEELGLVGVVAVIGLYVILVARALHIGRSAEKRQRPFAAFIAYGIGIWIGLQAFINMGVNMGVLPTKGLTLPFMSYGGSSIVVMCVALGMLLRVDMELRLEGRRSQPLQSFTW